MSGFGIVWKSIQYALFVVQEKAWGGGGGGMGISFTIMVIEI